MNPTLEVLIKAREIIADPKRWTQGWYAKDCDGVMTDSMNADAVCWCSMGALTKAAHAIDNREAKYLATRVLADVIDQKFVAYSVLDYNDHHSHEEVLQMFDKAIELAKSKGD